MAFPSVYEMFAPLTTVRKQHFWDYFSGATLNSRWTVVNGTAVPKDEADGGVILSTLVQNHANTRVAFNDIKPFSPTGSVVIGNFKATDALSTSYTYMGLTEQTNVAADANDNASIAIHPSVYTNNKYVLRTGDGTTSTGSDTDIAIDTDWHNHKITLSSSNVINSIDGVTKVTKTTNRPRSIASGGTALQPIMYAGTSTAQVHQAQIRYMECYNT